MLSLVLYPEFRSPRKILAALMRGGRTCATIMIVVAAIGFVVGMVNMSGLGIKFAATILSIAGDSLFLSLVVMAIGCLLLGMGVPVGAAYLIIVLIIGPALGKLGLSLLLTHLFVIYYAVLSAITPPVAIAAFAAAPIAGSKPIETGVVAVRLAIAGFLIPFIFVYHPSIVLVETGFTYAGLALGDRGFPGLDGRARDGARRLFHRHHRAGTTARADRGRRSWCWCRTRWSRASAPPRWRRRSWLRAGCRLRPWNARSPTNKRRLNMTKRWSVLAVAGLLAAPRSRCRRKRRSGRSRCRRSRRARRCIW